MSRNEAEITIRDATENDIGGIHGLEVRWTGEGTTINPVEAAAPDEIKNHPIIVVAESGGSLVGYGNADYGVGDGSESAVASGEKYLEIGDVYVVPEHRNRGVGGMLMEALVERGKRAGLAKFLLVAVSKDMDRLMRFHARHGFQVCPDSISKFGERRMIRLG